MTRRFVRTGLVGAVLGLAVPVAPPAHADELVLAPIPRGPTFRDRLEARLDALGEELDSHLRLLTSDTIRLSFDAHARRARLRLAGDSGFLRFEVDGDIHFRRGAAAIDATVHLGIAGHALRLELPNFEVVPRSYQGERYVEIRLPVLQGSF